MADNIDESHDDRQDAELFKLHLEALGLGIRARHDYYNIAKRFLLITSYNIGSSKEEHAKCYKEFFAIYKNSLYVYAIKAYLDFLGIKDFVPFKKMNKQLFKNVAEPKRKALNFNDIKRIIELMPYPFKLIAMLQWDSGCRISAILNLEIKNFREDDNHDYYIIVTEKGNRKRTIYLTKYLGTIIKDIIIKRNFQDGKLILYNSKAQAYKEYNASLKEHAKLLIGENISTHVIRRSRAVYMIKQGYNIETIKRFLGHKDISTTDIYLQSAGESSRNITPKEKFWN